MSTPIGGSCGKGFRILLTINYLKSSHAVIYLYPGRQNGEAYNILSSQNLRSLNGNRAANLTYYGSESESNRTTFDRHGSQDALFCSKRPVCSLCPIKCSTIGFRFRAVVRQIGSPGKISQFVHLYEDFTRLYEDFIPLAWCTGKEYC